MTARVHTTQLDNLWRDGFDRSDARTRRFVVAAALGGVPFMRRVYEALGPGIDAPGTVTVMSALLELKRAGLIQGMAMDGEWFVVEMREEQAA